jgi:ribosomal protein S18 acetylase RimI-like enzyme
VTGFGAAVFEPSVAQPLNPAFDPALLAAIEDASLNASAPTEQLWVDGWLLRLCPGKAKRARSINAVAAGRRPLAGKIAQAQALYAAAGLPCYVRLTPFTQPPGLEAQLAAAGFEREDDTRVMVARLDGAAHGSAAAAPLAAGCTVQRSGPEDYAEAVGAVRGSPAGERAAHARRVRHSPVPYVGQVLRRQADGTVLAGGQWAREGRYVGLYDVFTAPEHRRQGHAHALCAAMLADAAAAGAQWAYLQVEAGNHAARSIYRRLGFVEAYGYHYRRGPAAAGHPSPNGATAGSAASA